MSEEQAIWARQSLYENPGTRDELSDLEAQTLLYWGEQQIARLAAMNMDDASFEAAFDSLGGLLRRMNRLAARQSQLPQEDLETALNRIAEYAAQVGLPIAPDQLDHYLQQPTAAAVDTHANVQALIALIMSGQQPTS